MEDALEELGVLLAGARAVDLVDPPRCPRVHGRVHVVERPLVRGQLSVRVHVPLAAEEEQLLLRELGIDGGHRQHVEREVPCRVPRVLPLVGHRDDVRVVEVGPLVVATGVARWRRRRQRRVAFEPLADVVAIVLLRPEQPGDRPTLHAAQRAACGQVGREVFVEVVGLCPALGDDLVEVCADTVAFRGHVGQSKAHLHRLARGHVESVPGGSLRAEPCGVHRLGTVDDVVVDAVLREWGRVVLAPETLDVRLVLAEEQVRITLSHKPAGAERTVGQLDRVATDRSKLGMAIVASPRPGVAEPDRRQEVERSGVGTTVRRVDDDADVVGRSLRVGRSRRRSNATPRTRRCRRARTRRARRLRPRFASTSCSYGNARWGYL